MSFYNSNTQPKCMGIANVRGKGGINLVVTFCFSSFIYIELANKQNPSTNAHVGLRRERNQRRNNNKKQWISCNSERNTNKNLRQSTVAICTAYYIRHVLCEVFFPWAPFEMSHLMHFSCFVVDVDPLTIFFYCEQFSTMARKIAIFIRSQYADVTQIDLCLKICSPILLIAYKCCE